MEPSQPGNSYPGNNYPGGQQPDRPAYPQGPRPVHQQPAYGAQPYGQPVAPYPYVAPQPFSNKAIISMVMGGISVMFWPLGPITGIIGVVLGFMGMKESKQPGGTHRGWGLALAGLLTSAFMVLVSIALVGLMVWAFSMAENLQEREQVRNTEYHAEADLEVVWERLQLYAAENAGSLEPGGPVVRDGWESSYDEHSPRVTGKLTLKDLVYESELNRPLTEYTITINGKHSATVTNVATGSTLRVTDVGRKSYRISSGSSP